MNNLNLIKVFKPLVVVILNVCLFQILIVSQVYGQDYNLPMNKYCDFHKLDSQIDYRNLDTQLLNIAVFCATNKVRLQKGLKVLEFDSILYKAAFLHSKEMVERKFYSHENPYSKKYNSLEDRIFHFGINNENCKKYGENLLSRPILNLGAHRNKIRFKTKKKDDNYEYYQISIRGKVKKRLEPFTYREFADIALYLWMKSKGHKKNILNKDYNALGISCLVDGSTISKRRQLPSIYAVQVFAELTK